MPGTQRTRRTRTRVKRSRTTSRNGSNRVNGASRTHGTSRAHGTSRVNGSHTPADSRAAVLETIRNRRYIAFVRAIVGATRLRNSSR